MDLIRWVCLKNIELPFNKNLYDIMLNFKSNNKFIKILS
jgi:hypothetical protein